MSAILLYFCSFFAIIGALDKNNWTLVSNPIPTTASETKLFFPYYVDYSPCQCDKYSDSCDLFCCCDPECLKETKSVLFQCSQDEKTQREESCYLPIVVRREELFMFLCLFREKNPFLGHFYPEPNIARTDILYSEAVGSADQQENLWSFVTFFNRPAENLISSSYSYGSAVSTSANYLSLPETTLHGICSWFSPVRFLHSTESSCLVRLTTQSCVGEHFNVSSYAMPQPKLLEKRRPPVTIFGSASDAHSAIPVSVKYKCRTKLGNQQNKTSYKPNGLYLFNEQPYENNNENEEDCTIADDQTVPDIAKVVGENQMTVCYNAVIEVKYKFWWNSSQILNLSVIVILQNLEITDTLIEQKFSVDWVHAYEHKNTEISSQNGQRPVSVMRSGNPGYIFGLPIIGAVEDINGQLAIKPENQFFSWHPDISSLCSFSKLDPVLFGTNTTSSCLVQLNRPTFNDCDKLRGILLEGLNSLNSPSHLSKLGTLTFANEINFVEIIRQNLTAINLRSFWDKELWEDENATKPILEWINYPLCHRLPFHVGLDIFYAEAAFINGTSVFEIVGAYQYFNFTTWHFASRTQTDKYLLVSTVRFYKKPPLAPEPIKTYYLKERRFHCPSHVTCWDELLFPIMEINIGTPYAYSLAMTMFIVFGTIGTYFVTKPWCV